MDTTQQQLHMALARIAELERELSARPEALLFTPTHRHADGGLYRFVSKSKYKASFTFPGAAEWTDAVIYEAEDGKLYVTTPARWADRFTAVSPQQPLTGGGAK